MLTRIITSIVALGIFAGVLFLPPIFFTIAMAAVTLVMLYECYSATRANTGMKIIGFISAALLMLSIYRISYANTQAIPLIIISVILIIMLHMILIIAEHNKKSYSEVLANGFLTLYVVIAMSCIWLSKQLFDSNVYMLLIFFCAWSTDTFAYFTGKALGRHKLIPHVSPNKTVEGSIGGVIGAMVICSLYLYIINSFFEPSAISNDYLANGIIFGAVGGVFSQLGDLAASAIKRDTNIKDFGWIFPGHGGFMDRFDSVIFIAPFIFGLLILPIVRI